MRRLTNKYSGPNAVEESLLRGLKELKVPFVRNQRANVDVAVVLSGVDVLGDIIAAKKTGSIQKLIAGPNVVGDPNDHRGIMLDEAIDVVLVPSQWVADVWLRQAPRLANKLKVWPAGVSMSEPSTRAGQPIIYDKLGDIELVKAIKQELGLPTQTFSYGSFRLADYFSALTTAPYLIYLSRSESQGLALHEAWAHDVPTLVNESSIWQSGNFSWQASQINCPYLTPELGVVFRKTSELSGLIESIKDLRPRIYCNEYLSDRASVEQLLKFI